MRHTYYSKTIPRVWAIAILRDDMNKTWEDIAERMGLSPTHCRMLYREFDLIEDKKIL